MCNISEEVKCVLCLCLCVYIHGCMCVCVCVCVCGEDTYDSCVCPPSKDAGSQQIGFLLGSCGVAVALTSDACHKGLPKSLSGEIQQLKGKQRHTRTHTHTHTHTSQPCRPVDDTHIQQLTL